MTLPECPGIYLIKLDQPLETSKRKAYYYLGSAKNLADRIAQHRTASAAKFLLEANRRGIQWEVVMVITTETAKEARQLEAKHKRRKKSYSCLVSS